MSRPDPAETRAALLRLKIAFHGVQDAMVRLAYSNTIPRTVEALRDLNGLLLELEAASKATRGSLGTSIPPIIEHEEITT